MALWPDLYEIEEGLPELPKDEDGNAENGISFNEGATEDGEPLDLNSPSIDTYFLWWFPEDVEMVYPKLQWLVEGVLVEKGINVLYSPAGHLKSFNARDLAISVCLGESWQGRQTKRGTVCMVVAEGMSGMGARLRAWRQGHNRTERLPDNLRMIEHPIELLDPERVATFARDVAAIAELYGRRPVLIIIDTLGLCFGGDENSSKDMGTLVRHLDHLRRRCEATILVLHHTDKSGKAERGSVSLRGRADMMIRVSAAKNGHVTLKVDKCRDGRTGQEIHLEAHEERLSDGQSSVVLRPTVRVPAEGEDSHTTTTRRSTTKQGNADVAFQKLTPGMTYGEWSVASGLKGGTFDRAKKKLLDSGRVVQKGNCYFPGA